MSTSLLVLGGGRHQLSLISRAQERGVSVIVIDYLKDAPGRAVASHAVLQDALDVAGAIEVGRRFGVDGVITTGTDLAVSTMARVAHELGLPCYIDPQHAESATDKSMMAVALGEHGVPMPGRRGVDRPEALTFPVVVKPADSQGQRGVYVVREPDALEHAVEQSKEYSSTRRVVIDEFITGPEVTANAWIEDGRVRLLAVNDRISFNPPPAVGVAFQHVYPSVAAEPHLEEIARITESVARAYAMQHGPLYIQMIVSGRGPVVLEAAARVGGGHETSMFPLITGQRIEDRLIDLALSGECAPLEHDQRSTDVRTSVVITFVLGREGTIAGLSPLPQTNGVVEAGFYVGVGDRLAAVENSLGRIGYFVVQDESRTSALARASLVYDRIEVRNERDESLVFSPAANTLNVPPQLRHPLAIR